MSSLMLSLSAVRRIFVVGISVIALTLGFTAFSVAPAQAACFYYQPVTFSDGSWGKDIKLPSGRTIGYAKNVRDTCNWQWFGHDAVIDANYSVHMYIWESGGQSTVKFIAPWTNIYQDTPRIRIGAENCSGAHIYDRRTGNWLRWQFFGCWRS